MIRDRVLLGVIAGLIGNLAKIVVDEASLRLKISQRSFRTTAAGVWVSSKSQAASRKGQILGCFLDFGTGMLGGVATVQLLTATGRDQIIVKGLVSGVAIGSLITGTLNALEVNNVEPKDAASNLSYMVAHSVYGLVTTWVATKLGDASLFTEKWPSATFVRMVANNVK